MKKSVMLISLIVVVLLVGGIYFAYHNNSKTNSTETGNVVSNPTVEAPSEQSNVRVINVDAERWQYSQPEIHVKKGEHVKIMINNEDTKHGMVIPALGVSGIDSVEFTANETGSFPFRCPTMCGQGHMNMTGTLVVDA